MYPAIKSETTPEPNRLAPEHHALSGLAADTRIERSASLHALHLLSEIALSERLVNPEAIAADARRHRRAAHFPGRR